MEWIGLAIFLVLIFGGSSLLSAIREYNRQKHIEKIVAQLPEAERGAFVRSYLENPAAINKKFAEAD